MSNIPNNIKKMWEEAANLKEGMVERDRKVERDRNTESASDAYARKFGTKSPSAKTEHAKIREIESRPENRRKDGGIARFPREH